MHTSNQAASGGSNGSGRHASFRWLSEVPQDVVYGLRVLRKSPGFAAVAILTLALGIGANTAIFSLIDAVMLRALPVKDPATLVLLQWSARKGPDIHWSSSYGDCVSRFTDTDATGCSFSRPFLEDVRSRTAVFSGLAEFAYSGRMPISDSGPATTARGLYVSGDYFETLGVGTAVGRTLLPQDNTPASPPVLVLDYGYWQSVFGGDPKIVGRTIHLKGLPFTVVGVAEQRFVSLTPGSPYDLWIPLEQRQYLETGWNPRREDAGAWWIVAVGRLKPGITRTQAGSQLSALFFDRMVHGEKEILKGEDAPTVALLPAQSALMGVRRRLSTTLYALMSAVGLVLLIACANVAGLLLVRASGRRKEVAVRRALGASRGRIARQLLVESVALASAGGALGVLLAVWGARMLLAFLASSSSRPLGITAELDWRVLGFTLVATLATGVLFGLVPALRSMRVDLTPALKEGSGRGSTAVGSHHARWNAGNVLVVTQIALTVVILVGAGLLVNTLENLRSVDPGFSTENVLNFEVDSSLTGYKGARLAALYNELQERLSAVPGVLSVSYSQMTLLSGSLWTIDFHMPGTPPLARSDADYLPVGPNFFHTLGMRFATGRDFLPAELLAAAEAEDPRQYRTSPTPVVVNEAFVRKYLPHASPLGQYFGADTDESMRKEFAVDPDYHRNPGWVIIGVVRDAKYDDLRGETKPTLYVPSGTGGSFELRTSGDPTNFVPRVREIVRQTGNDLPVFNVSTQTQRIDELLYKERLVARASSLFAGLALLLACVGLFGLLSYEVGRRTQEIGIRIALGAQARSVLREVITRGLLLALSGATLGIALSFAVTRFLRSILFGVGPGDPVVLAGVAALMLAVALAACYLPARRATQVDPVIALRHE